MTTVDLVSNPGKPMYVYGGGHDRAERYAPTPEPERKKTWRDRANCSDAEDPEVFFPDPSDLNAHVEVYNEFCNGCPVKDECLADDLATDGTRWGIRGGKSAAERSELITSKSTRTPAAECRNGHRYTTENTITDSRGHRRCVTCLKRDQENRKAQRGAAA